MPRVAIGTVLRVGQERWYPLQRSFIRATTKDFCHIVASYERPSNLHGDTTFVPATGRQHAHGIAAIADFLATVDCDYSLLLDSDAFPVHRDWLQILARRLNDTHKAFAAPIRTEGWEGFPHVSFLFCRTRDAGVVLRWARRRSDGGGTFLGSIPPALGAALPVKRCFPLLRSNVLSVSPVMHSIYYDVAYHCGAGSRAMHKRPFLSAQYWNTRPRDGFLDISPSPAAFINTLIGQQRFSEKDCPV
jgi:hypothetical protein